MKQKYKSKRNNTKSLSRLSKRKISLLVQILVFFVAFMLISAILSGVLMKRMVYSNVMREREELTKGVSSELEMYIRQYTACDWVIKYLLEHKDEPSDIEYDTSFESDRKAETLLSKHRGLDFTKVTPAELDSFSPEDQKAYTEVVYNRWVTQFNTFIASYDLEFLYFFATDDQYKESIFVLNGAKEGLRRGTNFGEAYIFGVTVINNEQQHNAFSSLLSGFDGFVYSDGFMDYYRYLFKIGKWNIISGVTYEYADVQKDIDAQTNRYAFFFVLFHIVQAIVGMLLIYLVVLRPLRNVERAVKIYGKSKNSEEVVRALSAKQYNNEFGTLSQGIQEMILEIDEHIEHIEMVTTEKERISAELDIAAKIQADMLPRCFPAFPDRDEFDLYASMTPAKEVGGDFYDFFLVDDNHIALVMADVSGKGVPAALFMAITKILIKNRAQVGGTPSEILRDVNNQLCENYGRKLFVTVWLAIIDLNTGEGVSSNAGHEHPAIKRAGGQFELNIYRHSPAVAIMKNIPYAQRNFTLNPGDILFVYTDGVAEATNSENNFYGTDRMLEALNRSANASVEELLSDLKNDIDKFVGDAPQFDDITMLAFLYKGKEKNR